MKLQRTHKRMCFGISSSLAVDSSVSTSQLNEEDARDLGVLQKEDLTLYAWLRIC